MELFVGGGCFTHLTHLLLQRVISFSFGQKNYEQPEVSLLETCFFHKLEESLGRIS
jgi:hypothetical protein